jgi:uncharacterized protein YkwD
MRYPLQPIIVAAIIGCLLAVAAVCFRPGPPATPMPAALTPARQAPAVSARPSTPVPAALTPTRTPSAQRPTLTPEPTAKHGTHTPAGGKAEPPTVEDRGDARPPQRPMSPTTTPDLETEPASSSAPSTRHRVEAGDTIYWLAEQYGSSPEAILQANGLDEQGARSLDIGQELVIPVGDEGQQAGLSPGIVHQVQAGEALIIIAQRYGTTVETLMAANDLEDAELILAGQELMVPAPPGTGLAPPVTPISRTEPLAQTDAPTAAPQPAPTEPIWPTAPLSGTGTAKVVPPMNASEALTQTAVLSETAPTEVMTGTAGIEAGPAPELVALEAAMVTAVNAEREARGLPPYRVDDTLTAVARAHAQDMVARDYVGHGSPEGKRVRDRLRDAGLDLDRGGENYYVSTQSAEEAVAHTLSWFMDDPPHRNNILHGYYTRMGVGVAYRSPGWYIFVLDFAGD